MHSARAHYQCIVLDKAGGLLNPEVAFDTFDWSFVRGPPCFRIGPTEPAGLYLHMHDDIMKI